MVHHQTQVGCQDAPYIWGGRASTKLLVVINIPWKGFEKQFHKNRSTCRHDRTAGERLSNCRGSQIEIKPTLAHNNQLYVQWYALSYDEKKLKTR